MKKTKNTRGRKNPVETKNKTKNFTNDETITSCVLLAVGKTTITVNVLKFCIFFFVTVFLIRVFFTVGGELRCDGRSLAGGGV